LTVNEPAAVEAALWFHDAVYDPRSATNEEDSAAAASECLSEAGVARPTVDFVRQLVLCTKTHEPAGVPNAAVLIDIDLAILGQPSARFWEYEQAIRAEYAWVPTATFAQKRSEILTRFLRRPAIFQTAAFRARYESTARANLDASVARLHSTPA
jgi:predicted metal-dependent HD superfamily phosphohydrolase